MIAPITINDQRLSLAVDSLSDLSIITPEGAKALGLRVEPCDQRVQPAGNDNTLTCTGKVNATTLRMGDKTLANVQLYVCDISKSCSPALGILGLDLFPALGIEIHGVPVNYPRSPNHDDDFIEKEDPDFDVEWLEKYKAQPELREQLLAKIAPFIQVNDDIPPDSFCTHPSAVVHLNTGEASPVYVPQYRVSDITWPSG